MTLHLTSREAATLVAALYAWQNELSYHTVEELAKWHPELTGHEPLTIAEVDSLLWRVYAADSPQEAGNARVSTLDQEPENQLPHQCWM